MENFLHIGFTAVFRIRPVGKQGQTVHKQSLNRKKEWARERMLHTVHRCISENKAQKKKFRATKNIFFLVVRFYPPPPLVARPLKKYFFAAPYKCNVNFHLGVHYCRQKTCSALLYCIYLSIDFRYTEHSKHPSNISTME